MALGRAVTNLPTTGPREAWVRDQMDQMVKAFVRQISGASEQALRERLEAIEYSDTDEDIDVEPMAVDDVAEENWLDKEELGMLALFDEDEEAITASF